MTKLLRRKGGEFATPLFRWVKMVEMPPGDYAGVWAPIVYARRVGDEIIGVLLLKGALDGEKPETVAVSMAMADYERLDEVEIHW